MKTSRALLGVAAGIAAGAILGILFAPDKGRDTRKKIYRKGEDLADELNDKIEKKFDEFAKGITGKFFGLKNAKEPLRKAEMSEQ
jgi:gas vesicle protein